MLNAVYPVLGKQTELPLYLSGIGVCDPEYRVLREGGLVSHQFLITSRGEGELFVGGKRFILKENSIFYLAPAVPHEYRPLNGDWVTSWLVFRGDYADELMKKMGFDEYLVINDKPLDRLPSLFSLLMSAAKDPVSGGERCSVLLYEFVLCARGVMLLSANNSGKCAIADKAISFIDENFTRDITLDELSSVTGVSAQLFCRVFRAATGMRPVEYISNKRISEAKLKLISTDKSISEIAASVGFNDQNYFGVLFRRLTGLTPTQYRRQRM